MPHTIAVIDYGSGNLRSAAKALEHAALDAGLTTEIVITSDANAVRRADRIVLPGVGAFGDCMAGLAATPGMIDALEESVRGQGRPFLGICVGMQLLAEWGVEFGRHKGLGWIAGEVSRLQPADAALKIPHMGWNTINPTRAHPLLATLPSPALYFVHSYALTKADPADVLASCDYGGAFLAMVARGNIAGTQFHPEKSQAAGLMILKNFCLWRP
jgi:glutamine amidotransferase